MNYLLKSSRKNNNRGLIFGMFFIFVLLLVGMQWIFPSFFPSLFYLVGLPVWKSESKVSDILTTDASYIFNSKESLIAENQNLKKQIEETKNDLEELVLLREENFELKTLLGRDTEEKRIVASILSRPNFSPYDTLILDLGTENNVLVGDRVVAGKNIVLGEIIESHARFSKAKLYSSPGTEVSVLLGKEHIQAVALGRGAGNFEVRVPHDSNIALGDSVTMPSVNPFLFAYVEGIDAKDTDSFETIYFKNPVNIFTLKWVEVVSNSLLGE